MGIAITDCCSKRAKISEDVIENAEEGKPDDPDKDENKQDAERD
jgi:hypothetical protein